MIIRLFLLLLVLNLVAFAVRAEAAEPVLYEPILSDRMMAERDDSVSPEDIHQFQDRISRDSDQDRNDALAAVGSRLLSVSLIRTRSSSNSYASAGAQPDHR